jgi:glycosyltransferase involved in cell wall biosynthesis
MSRIAFISSLHDVPWGGSEALWHRTALRLKSRGHEVCANVQWWPQPPAPVEELQRAGVQVRARRRSTLARVREKFLSATADAKTKWLDEVRPDLAVISLSCHGTGLEWMQACVARKIPFIVVVHAVVDFWWPGNAQQKLLADVYNAARVLYFVSHANHRQVSIQLADALPSAQVVRNPFNVDYNAAPPWPDSGSTLRLACVGRLDPGTKGQDVLLATLARDKWKKRDWALTFFGSGPYESSLIALRDFLGLQDKIEIGGFSKNVEDIWKTHHALVLTSRAEGLPIVIVEAMLCARPCLVTDIAGSAELLQDNISGFIAAAPKVDFVDEALERLWQSRQNGELQNIGKNAADSIRKNIPPDPIQRFAEEIELLLS